MTMKTNLETPQYVVANFKTYNGNLKLILSYFLIVPHRNLFVNMFDIHLRLRFVR